MSRHKFAVRGGPRRGNIVARVVVPFVLLGVFIGLVALFIHMGIDLSHNGMGSQGRGQGVRSSGRVGMRSADFTVFTVRENDQLPGNNSTDNNSSSSSSSNKIAQIKLGQRITTNSPSRAGTTTALSDLSVDNEPLKARRLTLIDDVLAKHADHVALKKAHGSALQRAIVKARQRHAEQVRGFSRQLVKKKKYISL